MVNNRSTGGCRGKYSKANMPIMLHVKTIIDGQNIQSIGDQDVIRVVSEDHQDSAKTTSEGQQERYGTICRKTEKYVREENYVQKQAVRVYFIYVGICKLPYTAFEYIVCIVPPSYKTFSRACEKLPPTFPFANLLLIIAMREPVGIFAIYQVGDVQCSLLSICTVNARC